MYLKKKYISEVFSSIYASMRKTGTFVGTGQINKNKNKYEMRGFYLGEQTHNIIVVFRQNFLLNLLQFERRFHGPFNVRRG
jgi:hypothetical protein